MISISGGAVHSRPLQAGDHDSSNTFGELGGLRSVRSVARPLDRVDRFGRFGTRIAAKLRENAFRTICNFRFFDAEKVFSENFSDCFSVFRDFRPSLEELGIF